MTERSRVYTEGACFFAGTRRECGAYAYHIPDDTSPSQQPMQYAACSQRPGLTNQHMQVTAAIQGIQALARLVVARGSNASPSLQCVTTSLYVVKVVNEWAALWSKTGWVTKTKQPVKNADMLRELVRTVQEHAVEVRASQAADATMTLHAADLVASAAEHYARSGCTFLRGPVRMDLCGQQAGTGIFKEGEG